MSEPPKEAVAGRSRRRNRVRTGQFRGHRWAVRGDRQWAVSWPRLGSFSWPPSFGQVPGEGELRLSEVAAHGTRSTGLCSGYVLIAKTSEGDEVARRSTSEDRDEIW